MKGLTILGMLLVLAGCATTGTEKPQSFADREAYAVGIYTAVENTVTISMNNGAMSSNEGSLIIKQAEKGKVALDAAKAASAAGDPTTAATKLEAALIVLQGLQSYLNSGAAP